MGGKKKAQPPDCLRQGFIHPAWVKRRGSSGTVLGNQEEVSTLVKRQLLEALGVAGVRVWAEGDAPEPGLSTPAAGICPRATVHPSPRISPQLHQQGHAHAHTAHAGNLSNYYLSNYLAL